MTIAQQLANATTAGQKAAVTKQMRTLAALGAKNRKSPIMVIAGIRAAATRLKNKKERQRQGGNHRLHQHRPAACSSQYAGKAGSGDQANECHCR